MELVLFVLLVIMVLVAVCKLMIKVLVAMTPILFKKRIGANEAQRMKNLREMQEMGIEIVSDDDNPKNCSSVR